MEFRNYCVDENIIVREAMKRLDIIQPKVLFLIDKTGSLSGSLTDGDVRRFLLKEGKLDDCALAACNKNPLVAGNTEEAKRLCNDDFIAVPIVNADGVVVDVVVNYTEKFRKITRIDVPIVINAGGKGTRLDLFTKVLPKPLIPVGDSPIIERIMRRFAESGCNRFNIIVNYKKQLIKAYFSESDYNYDINWYDEEKPLGTGGGLSLLRNKLEETFIFTNCDILITEDYSNILKFHKENGNDITMVCAYQNIQIPYGVVEIGQNGCIKEMKEKPELSFLTNTGMYVVEPKVLDIIEDDVPIGFPDIIKKAMSLGMKVSAYPMSGENWMDMGQLPELEKMDEKLSRGI